MASHSMKSTIIAVGSLVTLALLSACGTISPPEVTGDSIPAGTVTQQGSNSVSPRAARPSGAGSGQAMVKTEAIAETVELDGIVAAQQEVPVTYSGSGKVLDIKVKSGQSVNEGDVLLELDAVELARSLDAAQARLQTSKANLAQAQAAQMAQQRSASQRAVAAQAQQQQAIVNAQADVRKAKDQLATVMVGASDTDKRAAETAVANAQAVLQRAQSVQDKLNAGPDPGTVRQAQAEAASAQIGVNLATSQLNALLKGPDPIAVSEAQREVDRANAQLQLAQATKGDPKADPTTVKLTHDSAVADAQLAVQIAQDRLARLKQPPADVDVQSAKQQLQNAQDALGAANDKVDALQQPPDQAGLDAAQSAVDQAQRGVADAQARLSAVLSRPAPAEIVTARDQVRRAQAALDAASTPAADSNADPGGVDLNALQEAINQDQADVDSLQQQVQSSRMVAPITGTVVAVRAKPGDTITSAKPVFVLAAPGAPIVRMQLSDEEAARVASGQQATVQLADGSSAAPVVPATIADMTPAKNGLAASAVLSVQWPDGSPPRIGLPVQVNVTLQVKQQALVVPRKAVRKSSGKNYVEVLDGTIRHLTTVQVGITATDEVEIVSGLSEGQVVLLTS